MPTLSLKTYIDIAAGLVLVAFLAWVFHEGVAREQAAEARAAAAQVVHNEEVQNQAAVAIAAAESRYQMAFNTAPVAPVHVSVCKPTRAVPRVAASTGQPVDAPDVPATVGPSGDDIGPFTDHLLDQADAQIIALQAVILAYQRETAHGK